MVLDGFRWNQREPQVAEAQMQISGAGLQSMQCCSLLRLPQPSCAASVLELGTDFRSTESAQFEVNNAVKYHEWNRLMVKAA